jgi:N6-adenosine-specific RNA methylase IME4
MATEDIAAMPVRDIAEQDAILFLWSTATHIPDALRVMDAWGFKYLNQIAWDKQKPGMGWYCRNTHELLLYGTRGNFRSPRDKSLILNKSIISSPRSKKHSEKPVEFYEIIERMYPDLPKVELFARRKRDGWASWGNEVARDYNPKILKRHFVPAARAV